MKKFVGNSMFQHQIEDYLEKLMPYAVLAFWVSAFTVAFSSIPVLYIWLNGIFGFIFLLMYILKGHINVHIKLSVTILFPFVIGIISFMDGGFISGGVTLILISNLLAVMLMPKRESRLTSVFSLVILGVLWIWFRMVGRMAYVEDAIFIIQYVVMAIFLLILHVVVYTVRHFLDMTIEELEDTLETVNELAYFDQLTGLENVHMMGKILDENSVELGDAGYIIIVKISNLRTMNTVHGDEAVDELLKILADRILDCSSDGDRVARIDGGTVAIWYRDYHGIDISYRLEELSEKISGEIKCGEAILRPAYYIAYARHDGGVHRKTYEEARVAMAYAREEEIREPLFYDSQHSRSFKERDKLKEEIYEALNEKAFYVAYQPKIDIVTGQTRGVEALARWKTKSENSVSPGMFIPLIEEINKALTFTNQIIDKIFDDWNNLMECYGQGITVSINVSPAVFMSPDFCEGLKTKAREAGIPNEAIMLELTEEVMIHNLAKVVDIQQRLKEAGFKLSLDDFGSGYASFTYLVEMAFDEIKIDRSLIWSLESDGMEPMVGAIIHMAKGLNIDLVAEGVETEEQKRKLEELGCHFMQGYLFAKPQPLEN